MEKKKTRFTDTAKNELRPMLAASSIGMVFVFSIVIGTLMGVWLDGKLNTKPWLTIIFMLLGVASGVKNAYHFIKKSGTLENIDNTQTHDSDNK